MEGWKLILDHVTRSLCIDIHYYLRSSSLCGMIITQQEDVVITKNNNK